MESHVKFLAQSLAYGRCSINGRCLCEEYYCYSSWGDHMWRIHLLWTRLDLCKQSGSWPCVNQRLPLHLLFPLQLTPR